MDLNLIKNNSSAFSDIMYEELLVSDSQTPNSIFIHNRVVTEPAPKTAKSFHYKMFNGELSPVDEVEIKK